MKSQNEKEFKALIKKYESLTEEMLLEESKDSDLMAELLSRVTGFGTYYCTLCNGTRKAGRTDCNICIYGIMSSPGNEQTACVKRMNAETYEAIESTDNLTDLLIAIKARAKHMRKVYKSYLKQRS